jgi:hypothetical protein
MKSARYFSSQNFHNIHHHSVHNNIQLHIYIAVIFHQNIPRNIATATSFTRGDVIRNENVTQSGIHHLINPTNRGIDEQVQNGVMAQNKEANRYSNQNSLFFTRKFLIFSIGR